MSNPFSLEGQTVFVTGGTRGLGRAISLEFARAGARVIAAYLHNRDSADSLLEEAKQDDLAIEVIRGDLSREKGIASLVEQLGQKTTALTGFVHCAANGVHHPFEELKLRHFDYTFAVNVRAFFDMTQRLLPMLGPGSNLLAISSVGAVRAVDRYTLVGSCKGAIESMVRHLTAELAPKGIRCNALAPGTIETDTWKVLPDGARRLEQAREQSPFKRLASLEEVARTARFLCSPASSGIAGQTIVVDTGCRIME